MAWLEGWSYRRPVTLSRPSGAVANYQMKFLVDEDNNEYNFKNLKIEDEHKSELGPNDTDNVILALGTGGAWDSVKISHPCVVEKDGTVYLFYAGYDGAKWRIGVATAPTAGFNGKGFTKSGNNPILTVGGAGTWDENYVCFPFVIYDADAGIWKMWYSGYSAASIYAIGYAYSNNPDSGWTKHEENPRLSPTEDWETTGVRGQSVLRIDSSTYKMLYTGGSAAIGLATSSDGVSWTKEETNPVLSATGTGWEALMVMMPRALNKIGSEYRLLYVGKPTTGGQYSQIGYAYSSDLISWTRGDVNPVLSPTKTWESFENENPMVLRLGGTEYIYYDCWFGTPASIGGAIIRKPTCNGHVLPSFNDLRFTKADGITLLDYWIESIAGTTPNQLATVWVEFDSIEIGDTTFYMYYGKADALAVSSGADTFIVFDDFERGVNGDAVGGDWTVVSGAVQISTEYAYGGTRCAKILGSATYANATIPVTSSDNIAIRFRAWKENAALQGIQHGDGGGSGWSLASRFQADESISIYDGASYIVKGTGTPDTWQLFEFNDFVWASALCDLWHQGKRIADSADISYAAATYANKFLITGYGNAAGVDWYIDDLIVRNFRTVEPAWGSWGDEEEESGMRLVVWIN